MMMTAATRLFVYGRLLPLMLMGITATSAQAAPRFTAKTADWLAPPDAASMGLDAPALAMRLGTQANVADDRCSSHWLYTTYACFKEGAGSVCGDQPTCRDSSFGREAQNVCNAPEEFTQSGKDKARAELPDAVFSWRATGKDEALCLTCDNMPYQTDAEIAAKRDCLRESAARVQAVYAFKLTGPRGVRSYRLADYMVDINQRGRTLFEVAQPSAGSQTAYLPFYLPTEDILVHLHPEDLDTDVQSEAQTQLCEALLQTHVAIHRVRTMYDTCLHGADTQRSTETVAQHVQRQDDTIALAKDLFGVYVRRARTQDASRSSVLDAMVHAWTEQALAFYDVADHDAVREAGALMAAYARNVNP